jgi:hypothetical protein
MTRNKWRRTDLNGEIAPPRLDFAPLAALTLDTETWR